MIRAPARRLGCGGSCQTAGPVSTDPLVIGTNLLLAALLVLLMPFPAELFNRTLDEHYDEVLAWLGKRRTDAAKARRERVRASWWTLGGTIVAGALRLLDPGYGWNTTTLGLVVGTLVAFLVLTLVHGDHRPVAATGAARRRALGPGAAGALLVAAACVLVSRLIGFLPGYLYGLLGYGPVESATPFVVAGSLFAGFALVSTGFWAWFRLRKAPSGAPAPGEGTASP